MTRSALALCGALLLGGCADTAPEANTPAGKSGAASVQIESAPDSARTGPLVDAERLLAEALAQAKSENKRVLLHLGAPWCSWCKAFQEFLAQHANLFADDFVVLKIDVEAMEHGGEIAKRLRGERDGGIPWIVILDGDGTQLVTSDGPDGNIGFPVTEPECGHFRKMMESTMQHAPAGRIAEIAKALEEFTEAKRRAASTSGIHGF
jgi:thiol-disulfide isomerase/thioredoxin